MLAIVHVVFAAIIMQFVTAHFQETGESTELFGSYQASLLTLYKATTSGEDWGVSYDVLHSMSATGSTLFLLFLAFVQFALVNIITGIFVDTAMKSVTQNSQLRAEDHHREEVCHYKELVALLSSADQDSSGSLTREELHAGFHKGEVVRMLALLGLKWNNVVELFDIMSTNYHDGKVNVEEFVESCMSLKGSATGFDLHMLHSGFHCAQSSVDARLGKILALLREQSQSPKSPSCCLVRTPSRARRPIEPDIPMAMFRDSCETRTGAA